jgi:hypothetical protein
MDILAGMLAYVAGIGALFAAFAISFFVVFATPEEPVQTQPHSQSANAMLVRPSTPTKPATVEAHATQRATQRGGHSEKHPAAAVASSAAAPMTAARNHPRKPAASTAQARQLTKEEHARRWAYQQDSSFESRFLGYAD